MEFVEFYVLEEIHKWGGGKLFRSVFPSTLPVAARNSFRFRFAKRKRRIQLYIFIPLLISICLDYLCRFQCALAFLPANKRHPVPCINLFLDLLPRHLTWLLSRPAFWFFHPRLSQFVFCDQRVPLHIPFTGF